MANPYQDGDTDHSLDYGGGQRLCLQCRKLKPEPEFTVIRSQRDGEVFRTTCNACHHLNKEVRSALKNVDKRDQAIKLVVAELQGTKINVPHISELAAEMIRQLGGLEQFCILWKHHIECIMVSDPSSNRLTTNLKAIAHMISESTKERLTAPDVNQLTEADMEAELSRLVGRVRPAEEAEDAEEFL